MQRGCLSADKHPLLRKKFGIILVEQNSYVALNLADKGYVLEIGKGSLEGRPQGLLNNEHVKKGSLMDKSYTKQVFVNDLANDDGCHYFLFALSPTND